MTTLSLTPSQWNILIADDEPDSVRVAEMTCNFHGARVRTALSGQRCLELIEEELPDILLVDIQMPIVSGWQVLNTIRANPRWQNLTVIAVTAHALPEQRDAILAGGFDGYFSKPISPLKLIDNIRDVLAQKEQRKVV